MERAVSSAEVRQAGEQAGEVQSLREELAARRRQAAAGSAMGLLAAAAREHEQAEQGQARATAERTPLLTLARTLTRRRRRPR